MADNHPSTTAHAVLCRLEAAHAEFQRIAAETVAMLEGEQRASLARQERIRRSYAECHAAFDALLAKLVRP
jgi:hypothetical protein